MGCFASHFSLWRKCIELGQPIIILEHDAIFVSQIPSLRFKHINSLSYSSDWDSQIVKYPRRNGENYYPFACLRGAGSYAITPEGAHLLVEDAHHGVAFAVDNFIRLSIVNIVEYYPSPIHQMTYFSSISNISVKHKTATKR